MLKQTVRVLQFYNILAIVNYHFLTDDYYQDKS